MIVFCSLGASIWYTDSATILFASCGSDSAALEILRMRFITLINISLSVGIGVSSSSPNSSGDRASSTLLWYSPKALSSPSNMLSL